MYFSHQTRWIFLLGWWNVIFYDKWGASWMKMVIEGDTLHGLLQSADVF